MTAVNSLVRKSRGICGSFYIFIYRKVARVQL